MRHFIRVIMNKIDFSYIAYPENSYGRIHGRRNQAWELAARATGKSIDDVTQLEVAQASIVVVIGEVKRIACNNWRKSHGLPMRRRCRK